MKIFVNILLGLFSAACAAALVLQGFLFSALPGWADFLLRLGCGLFAQILLLRLSGKKLVQYLPLEISAVACLWGFFLLLTSPSWRNATVGGFFQDYVSFFCGCLLVVIFDLLRPRLKKAMKKLRRELKRRRKQKQMKDIPHS
jgi:hypothetical protein